MTLASSGERLLDKARQLALRLPVVRNRYNRQLVKWYVKTLRRSFRRVPANGGLAQPSVYRVSGSETFVGYYDVCPFSADQTKLLAHAVPGGPAAGHHRRDVHIGWFDLASGAFHEVGTSSSWCWQMGSRLRWHPLWPNSRILFNALEDGRHATRVYDLPSRRIVARYRLPLFDVAGTGAYGLSVNFARVGRLRPGYGYDDLPDETLDEGCSDTDGLWRVDLGSGSYRLIASYRAMAAVAPRPSMVGAHHYVNMIMIAPNGGRAAFLHLWVERGGASHARLMQVDAVSEKLTVLADDARPSHGWWIDDQRFLVTMVHSAGWTEWRTLGSGGHPWPSRIPLPHRDGHPSLSPTGQFLVTDSYPDRFGEQNLEVIDLESGQLRCLAKLAPGRRYVGDEVRCDLHPRWSPRGDMIAFDSAHSGGGRAVYLVQLDQALKPV